MSKILVWFNNRWIYDQLTFKEYEGEQPRPPKFRVGEWVLYRRNKVKIEWSNVTITNTGEQIFWYDVAKENAHSTIAVEEDLKTLTKHTSKELFL